MLLNTIVLINKICLLLFFYDITGYVFNKGLFKFKTQSYILLGFVINVCVFGIAALPVILLKQKLVMAIMLYVLLYVILLRKCEKDDILKDYNPMTRLMAVKLETVIAFVVLSVLLLTLSVSGIDQWLYGGFVNSAVQGYPLQYKCGPIPCDQVMRGHYFNTYYPYNGMLISVLGVSYLQFTFGVFRIVEVVIIIQALRELTKFTKNNSGFILLMFGVLGIGILSPKLISSDDFVLLFSGNMGTYLFWIVSPVMVYNLVRKYDQKLMILLIIFASATTTSFLPVAFILFIILPLFNGGEKLWRELIVFLALLSFELFADSITNNLEFVIYLLVSIALVFSYIKVPTKIQIYLSFALLLVINMKLELILKNSLIFNKPELLFYIIIIYIGTKDNELRRKYSYLMFAYTILINIGINESIDVKSAILQYRMSVYLPINLLIVDMFYTYVTDRRLKYFLYGVATFIIGLILISDPVDGRMKYYESIKRNVGKYDNYESLLINSEDVEDMINYFGQDEDVDLYYRIEPKFHEQTDITPISYLPAFSANISLYGPSTKEYFCKDTNNCYYLVLNGNFKGPYKYRVLKTKYYSVIKKEDLKKIKIEYQ